MKYLVGPTVVICAALALTGCVGTTAQSELATTKPPVQLLRNEAANRLISGTDESVGAQDDFSAACKTEQEDPEGLYRSWRSTLLAEVPQESAIGVDQFVGALATSFSEDGWVFTEEHDGSAGKITTMTRSGSIVTLTFTAQEGDGDGATVLIEASGPCVLTGGPDSDEVKNLEK